MFIRVRHLFKAVATRRQAQHGAHILLRMSDRCLWRRHPKALNLSAEQQANLIAFLRTLDSEPEPEPK